MKPFVRPGEVWVVDLGIAAKIRPVLVLTTQPGENDLTLVTVIAHTTAVRGDNPGELSVPKPWLKEGVFHLQQINSPALVKFERRLGALTEDEFSMVKAKVAKRLGISASDLA
jgi:mRNA interferase MazF